MREGGRRQRRDVEEEEGDSDRLETRRRSSRTGQDRTGQSISAREGPSVKRQWGDSEERHCRWRGVYWCGTLD